MFHYTKVLKIKFSMAEISVAIRNKVININSKKKKKEKKEASNEAYKERYSMYLLLNSDQFQ